METFTSINTTVAVIQTSLFKDSFNYCSSYFSRISYAIIVVCFLLFLVILFFIFFFSLQFVIKVIVVNFVMSIFVSICMFLYYTVKEKNKIKYKLRKNLKPDFEREQIIRRFKQIQFFLAQMPRTISRFDLARGKEAELT